MLKYECQLRVADNSCASCEEINDADVAANLLSRHSCCSFHPGRKSHIAQSNTLVTKHLVIFSHIWAPALFPLVWTSPRNSSLTPWESLSMYLAKVANSVLSDISVVSSANIPRSVTYPYPSFIVLVHLWWVTLFAIVFFLA